MARTVTEIYNSMIAEKDSLNGSEFKYPQLQSLDSSSKVAVFKLMYYIMAFGIWSLEMLFDKHAEEVEQIRSQSILHTEAWLVDQAKNWQYGDLPVLINGVYQYENIDETKMLIKQAAVSDIPGRVYLKVAKEDNGILAPLDKTIGTEYDTFFSYVNKYKAFPGQFINVISQDADVVKVNVDIYYNATIGISTITNDITTAINKYISGLPFNGIFRNSSFVDILQNVEGVTDIELHEVQAKVYNGDYTPVTRLYNALAGYMTLDTESTINYVAD